VSYFVVPFDVLERFGTRGGCPVTGTLAGHLFRSHLYATGDGRHTMVVRRDLLEAAGVRAGVSVDVTMVRDDRPRVVEPPPALAAALAASPAHTTRWSALSRKQQKAIVRFLDVKTASALERKLGEALRRLEESSP
jgi:hypothetical protein